MVTGKWENNQKPFIYDLQNIASAKYNQIKISYACSHYPHTLMIIPKIMIKLK